MSRAMDARPSYGQRAQATTCWIARTREAPRAELVEAGGRTAAASFDKLRTRRLRLLQALDSGDAVAGRGMRVEEAAAAVALGRRQPFQGARHLAFPVEAGALHDLDAMR